VPVIGECIGGTPYAYNLASYLTKLPVSLIELRALANVDCLMVGTEWHSSSFEKFYKDIPKVVYPMPQCVDFDIFKPMSKVEARKELGIPLDKRIVLHVGRFDSAKGFDTMLDIMPALKAKYDVGFYGIGGLKTDQLYNQAVANGAKVLEFIPQLELIKYYCASDVFLFPKFYDNQSEEDSEKFMGAGVACIEALGCGIPVVGTNMKGFYATPEEFKNVGIVPKNKDDLILCIARVFECPEYYHRCREIAMKYHSWSPVIDRNLSAIEELEAKYYGRGK
jgi:glycosyltransferase involved in cell wall biosynthesis